MVAKRRKMTTAENQQTNGALRQRRTRTYVRCCRNAGRSPCSFICSFSPGLIASTMTMFAAAARVGCRRNWLVASRSGRRNFASASSAGGPERATETGSTRKRLRSNGTPEIVFGAGLLTLLAADQLLQSQQEAQHKSGREAVFKRLQRDVDADMAKERSEGHTLSLEEESSKPSLFQCRVMAVPKYFDGTKSLMGVEVGDVVDVLEEQVGPGGTYNLCRLVRQNDKKQESVISVGWYPMGCLEKVKA